MEISVKNFGPIKHGSIDLSKRFYVFVGHNNSGKTYMANLVWNATNLRNFAHWHNSGSRIDSDLDDNNDIIQLKKNDLVEFNLDKNFYDKIFTIYENKIKDDLKDNLGIDKSDNLILKSKIYLSYKLDEIINKNIENCLYIFNFKNKEESLFYELSKQDNENKLKFKRISIDLNQFEDNLINPNSLKKIQELGYEDIHISGSLVITKKDLVTNFANMLIRKLIPESGFRNTFLPANRLFYPSFYRYIYESAKTDKDKIDDEIRKGKPSIEKIKSLSKRPYTEAMDDLLSAIYRLDANQKPNKTYTDLLRKLRKLMGGEIITKNAEGIGLNEFKLKMDSGEELDLYLSSSAANQLTTLYLYLKYWASDENNFLIMDEPEENLHPKHQIALLDILMQFANRNNNRVLITTHSSLLAESVNNHIQIGKLQDLGEDVEKIVQENNLNISLNENLRPDDFGVYFFGNNTITPYDVDDYGVFFRDFKQEEDKVASTAQVLSEHIYHSLRKDKTVPA